MIEHVRQTQAAKLGVPLTTDQCGSSRDYYYSFLSITTYTTTTTTTTVDDSNLLSPHWKPHGAPISERIPGFKTSASTFVFILFSSFQIPVSFLLYRDPVICFFLLGAVLLEAEATSSANTCSLFYHDFESFKNPPKQLNRYKNSFISRQLIFVPVFPSHTYHQFFNIP